MSHPFHKLCDAHTHIGTESEIKERLDKKIRSLICASTPLEAAKLQGILSGRHEQPSGIHHSPEILIPTYGLHPWHAGSYKVSEMAAYFDSCPVIGEIGLDSVWCGVSPKIQETAFVEQLSIACELKKPVILHTKGQERKTADIIKKYNNTYLIHWYSASENPLNLFPPDCYYSVGPDVWWNENVRHAVSHIPAERLLAETDGMSAVAWAYTESPVKKGGACKEAPPKTVSDALQAVIREAAAIKELSPDRFGIQAEHNFLSFLNSGGTALC